MIDSYWLFSFPGRELRGKWESNGLSRWNESNEPYAFSLYTKTEYDHGCCVTNGSAQTYHIAHDQSQERPRGSYLCLVRLTAFVCLMLFAYSLGLL